MRIPPDSEAGDRANTRAVMLQTSGKQQGEASMASEEIFIALVLFDILPVMETQTCPGN